MIIKLQEWQKRGLDETHYEWIKNKINEYPLLGTILVTTENVINLEDIYIIHLSDFRFEERGSFCRVILNDCIALTCLAPCKTKEYASYDGRALPWFNGHVTCYQGWPDLFTPSINYMDAVYEIVGRYR